MPEQRLIAWADECRAAAGTSVCTAWIRLLYFGRLCARRRNLSWCVCVYVCRFCCMFCAAQLEEKVSVLRDAVRQLQAGVAEEIKREPNVECAHTASYFLFHATWLAACQLTDSCWWYHIY